MLIDNFKLGRTAPSHQSKNLNYDFDLILRHLLIRRPGHRWRRSGYVVDIRTQPLVGSPPLYTRICWLPHHHRSRSLASR